MRETPFLLFARSLQAHFMLSFWHSQVAGIKAAGAKVWGPLMNVVTPQKLFLFVLFQVRHVAHKVECPAVEKPRWFRCQAEYLRDRLVYGLLWRKYGTV